MPFLKVENKSQEIEALLLYKIYFRFLMEVDLEENNKKVV